MINAPDCISLLDLNTCLHPTFEELRDLDLHLQKGTCGSTTSTTSQVINPSPSYRQSRLSFCSCSGPSNDDCILRLCKEMLKTFGCCFGIFGLSNQKLFHSRVVTGIHWNSSMYVEVKLFYHLNKSTKHQEDQKLHIRSLPPP